MTTLSPQTWEHTLLSFAHEARRSPAPSLTLPSSYQGLLASAYDACEAITAEHSHSFHMATRLLPYEKRRSVRALYAFCRVCDNIVDHPQGDPQGALSAWRQKALATLPPYDELVAIAWADTRLRYHIPTTYAEQLIEGVSRDLQQKRYETFEELTSYAYGVASTVGLMSMHIIGFSSSAALPYAIKLGVALQITNILRDVGEDWRAGRMYLPMEEFSFFGLEEADLERGEVDERWRAFMRFQIERNRQLYRQAWPGIAMLHRDGRLAVAAAGELYRAILDDIEAHDYDVFNRRAHVSAWGKINRLPGIWWRNN